MYGFVTPAQILLLVGVVAVVVVLGKLARPDARAAAAARGRQVRRGWRGWRFTKPTRRQAHIAWLVASALVAFALTRAVALPLFLLVFLAVWLCGYWALVKLYR